MAVETNGSYFVGPLVARGAEVDACRAGELEGYGGAGDGAEKFWDPDRVNSASNEPE